MAHVSSGAVGSDHGVVAKGVASGQGSVKRAAHRPPGTLAPRKLPYRELSCVGWSLPAPLAPRRYARHPGVRGKGGWWTSSRSRRRRTASAGARVADRARGALAGRRLTLSDGANGLSQRIRLGSREQLPSGADPGLAVSAAGIPPQRGKGERWARLDFLEPVLEREMTELPDPSGGEPVHLPALRAGVNLLELGVEPADLGVPAQRILRAHVESVEVLRAASRRAVPPSARGAQGVSAAQPRYRRAPARGVAVSPSLRKRSARRASSGQLARSSGLPTQSARGLVTVQEGTPSPSRSCIASR